MDMALHSYAVRRGANKTSLGTCNKLALVDLLMPGFANWIQIALLGKLGSKTYGLDPQRL